MKILLLLTFLIASVAIVETYLWQFQEEKPLYWPLPIDNPQANAYGWGYPGQTELAHRDQDTGKIFFDRLNAAGWRDVDHSHTTENKAFRILVLGDETTFGSHVPLHETYPRILETMLKEKGYWVEVISMAYPHFSTDLEMKALQHSGLKLNPQLIILQFSRDDLKQNLTNTKLKKPFHWVFKDHSLQAVPNHIEINWREKLLKNLLDLSPKSQLATQIMNQYMLRSQFQPLNSQSYKYKVDSQRINHLKQIYPQILNSTLESYLAKKVDKILSAQEMNQILTGIIPTRYHNTFKLIFEDRSFNEDLQPELWQSQYPSIDSEQWRVTLALIRRMAHMSRKHEIPFALLNNDEEGAFRWRNDWMHVSDDEENRKRYFGVDALLEEFSFDQEFAFIPHTYVHHRMRNANIPNSHGHKNIAMNISQFVEEYFETELNQARFSLRENSNSPVPR